jgi:hypothetical protein
MLVKETRPNSKFDELYQKALQDTENILASTAPQSLMQLDGATNFRGASTSKTVVGGFRSDLQASHSDRIVTLDNNVPSDKSSHSNSRCTASASDYSHVSGSSRSLPTDDVSKKNSHLEALDSVSRHLDMAPQNGTHFDQHVCESGDNLRAGNNNKVSQTSVISNQSGRLDSALCQLGCRNERSEAVTNNWRQLQGDVGHLDNTDIVDSEISQDYSADADDNDEVELDLHGD